MPKANAVSQGPTALPPKTKLSTFVACLRHTIPTPIISPKKQISIGMEMSAVVEKVIAPEIVGIIKISLSQD